MNHKSFMALRLQSMSKWTPVANRCYTLIGTRFERPKGHCVALNRVHDREVRLTVPIVRHRIVTNQDQDAKKG